MPLLSVQPLKSSKTVLVSLLHLHTLLQTYKRLLAHLITSSKLSLDTWRKFAWQLVMFIAIFTHVCSCNHIICKYYAPPLPVLIDCQIGCRAVGGVKSFWNTPALANHGAPVALPTCAIGVWETLASWLSDLSIYSILFIIVGYCLYSVSLKYLLSSVSQWS